MSTTRHSTIRPSAAARTAGALRRRVAFVGLVAALGLSTTACQFGSSERAVDVDTPVVPATVATDSQPDPAAGVDDNVAVEPIESLQPPVVDGNDTAGRDDLATDPDPSNARPSDDPARPAGDGTHDDTDAATAGDAGSAGAPAPVVVVIPQQPATSQPATPPTVAAPPTSPTTTPTTPPTVPPTLPPTTTAPSTTLPPTTTTPPTTTPPTTAPPTTMPPTTLPPTTLPPTTVPTQYFVTIGQIGVKAGDCVVHAGDTSTFMEGWGGAFGAPQYHVQTYVSTTDHTLVGEPSYTVTTTPGSREVWGQLQWSFSGLTQTDTISFNVRNVGSTTIRDHRSVTLLAGGTCSPDIEYTITVAEQV